MIAPGRIRKGQIVVALSRPEPEIDPAAALVARAREFCGNPSSKRTASSSMQLSSAIESRRSDAAGSRPGDASAPGDTHPVIDAELRRRVMAALQTQRWTRRL